MGSIQSKTPITGGDKVTGLQLPVQSGKTRKMEEKIKEFMIIARSENNPDDINILISSNNKILVSQTATRLNNDLGPQDNNSIITDSSNDSNSDNGEEYILKNGADTWTSSNNKSINDIYTGILDDNIDMIVACAHSARFKRLFCSEGLVKKLEKSKHFNGAINIWIDEAHKSIRLWKKYLDILLFKKVKRVTLVTATWDIIDKEFEVNRYTYDKTHPDVYLPLSECKWKIIEQFIDDNDSVDENDKDSLSSLAYVKQIFTDKEYLNIIEKPGKNWLISGNSRTITHDQIADYLTDRGWNGLKLNGKEKSLIIYMNNKKIDYIKYNSKNEEPKDVLISLFNDYPNLIKNPFFVTGLNCIKEGITFQGEKLDNDNTILGDFLFDGAIIPNMNNPSDAYQLVGRIAGNIKNTFKYIISPNPLIITTSKMKKKILFQENIAINLPRILYEDGRTLPTLFDKKRASRGKVPHDPNGLGYRIFGTRDLANKFLKLAFNKNVTFPSEPNGSDEYIGKHVCSVQSSRGAKQQPRYLTEVIDKIDLAYGGKGSRTSFPCYLDIEKAPEGLVWVIVIAEKNINKENLTLADKKYPEESVELLKIAKHYS